MIKPCSRSVRLMMIAVLGLAAGGSFSVEAEGITLDADDIVGTVKSSNGREAGVWVIAETRDLATPFARIVVTDDRGQYVIPELPKAHYRVWVRGYGLLDSKPVDAELGGNLDLAAVMAPTPRAAAQVYPAQYWSALLRVPDAGEFPGTGPSGNGIGLEMRTQQHWLVHLQENCMMCHELGDKATRALPTTGDSIKAWEQRLVKVRGPKDPNINNAAPELVSIMNSNLMRFGRERALKMFADWTDRIARGAVPEPPRRPSGIERNVVVTVRDYGGGTFARDPVASDRRNPSVNARGLIYGMGLFSGNLEVLDPVTNRTRTLPIPGLDGSPHDDSMMPHHAQMDAKGRVWVAMVSKGGRAPSFCTDGSTAFSKYYPYVGKDDEEMANGISGPPKAQTFVMYDPASGTMHVFTVCAGGNHISIGWDRDATAYLAGDGTVISWFKTKVWDETHDVSQAYGWCPMVLDTSGDGKITPDRKQWNAWGKPADPNKDTQFKKFLYGINVGKDGNVWAAGYLPLMPSSLVRLHPGEHPPQTCVTEAYDPPMRHGQYLAYGLRGVSVDSDGVAWAAFASGQIGSFDRRKCKVVRGPTATGQQCPEGWTIYDVPGPKIAGTSVPANVAYGAPVDFANVFGLGADTVFFPTMNADAFLALDRKTQHFLTFRVPYPMGFYPRDLQFRVDDAKAGWKGRTIYAGYTQFAMWHQEQAGAFSRTASKIASFQLRPDPLAH
jgi:hypothetical protein